MICCANCKMKKEELRPVIHDETKEESLICLSCFVRNTHLNFKFEEPRNTKWYQAYVDSLKGKKKK